MPERSLTFPKTPLVASVAAAAVGLSVAGATAVLPAQAASGATVHRVSAAPFAVKDSSGATWAARSGFDKGDYSDTYADGRDIAGTTEDSLYRHEFVRMSSWSAPVAAGTYDVTLKMREGWWNAPGQRVFDVTAEGRTALTGVDIVKAVGKDRAYDRTFRTTVTDGRLDLGFSATKDAALVSAIQVTKVADATPPPANTTRTVVARVGVSPTTVKDAAGSVFAARTGFDKGDYHLTYGPGADIKGTTSDALYRPELVRFTSWRRTLPNGTYDVTLKMREGWWNAAGRRVFDVTAEGRPALTGVDIFKAVGKGTAYDRTFRTTVADGRLDLGFTARRDAALVSAIVVTRIGAPATPAPITPAPTTPAPPPASPKPTNPPVKSGRVSGLIFDSGVFSMHRAGEVTKLEAARGAKYDVIGVHPTRNSWSTLHQTWWMDGERIPAGFRGTLDVAMPLWPDNGNIATAASGGYNAEWERFARTLAARFPDAYVRPGWEMNLPGWKHAAYPAQAEQWKQAFRHAYTSMKKAAPGLRIAWVVNEGPGQTGTEDAAMFYPGNAHVDLIGMDAYDWWPGYTNAANIAKHRDGKYGWNHWMNFARAHGKKFVLPEWGVAPANGASGGDNPMFVNFVYSWLKQNQDWIAFEAYFHEADGYIRSDLFSGTNPKASAEYKRWMPLLRAG